MLATFAGTSLADRSDSGDSSTAEVSPAPSPSPTHHKRAHSKKPPSPTPAQDDGTAGQTNSDGDTSPTPKPSPSFAPDATLDTNQLKEFSQQPPNIQSLIESSLALTRQNLTYTYSSADPANGGMDCSGFVYYVLTQAGAKDVPRDASEQYVWVRKAGNFRAVISRRFDGFEMDELKPGDLLFWIGTYNADHDPPVTHTMIYLGREKDTGDRVMVGSSDGRSYHGVRRWGVNVFDLKPPIETAGHDTAQFIGYGAIPGL